MNDIKDKIYAEQNINGADVTPSYQQVGIQEIAKALQIDETNIRYSIDIFEISPRLPTNHNNETTQPSQQNKLQIKILMLSCYINTNSYLDNVNLMLACQ